jgi:hypothetical protein
MIDPGGANLLFPGEKDVIGKRVRIGSESLRVVAMSDASAPFTGFPILHMARTTTMMLRQAESGTRRSLWGPTNRGQTWRLWSGP